MTRVTDALLSGPFTDGYTTPMVDIRTGGQGALAPNLREWVSNQAYVQRNIIALLIEAPLGFRYFPDPDFMISGLKALIETQPKSITGLNATITVEFGAENPVGGGGEMQQDFTNITRERSRPQFTWVDKPGRVIQNFLKEWITGLMGDPDTKVPNIATVADVPAGDLLADVYTCTVLFFEPDPTRTSVVNAWLCTNMAPQSTGDITGKRELSGSMEQLELNIEFTALTSSSLGVRLFAQSILDSINFTNTNPNLQPAFVEGIQADIAAANTGYAAQAERMGNEAIARQ